ncbi:MAG: mechanosensitive ion channel domain-containing protein [Pseudomonadota bacterium]
MQGFFNYQIGGMSVGDILSAEFLTSILGSVVSAIIILIVGFAVARWASKRVRSIGGRKPELDITLFNFLGNITRYVILVLTFLFVLNTFGVQTTSIVAIIGAASLAIGLALQGTLSNVAAGVMIVLFRPIKIGDFVAVAGETGSVKDVTLNFIELATLDNVQVIIPNGQVWGNTIVNYSIYETRRAEWVFGVSYDTDLQKAEKVILDAVLDDDRALKDPEPFIQVSNLGDFSVDFTVRVWCASGDFLAFSGDATRRVKDALDRENIDIPFPTAVEIQQSA